MGQPDSRYLVLPETPDRLHERLAQWLKDHLQQRRNTVRFVLPRADLPPVFSDPSLLFFARAVVKALEWQKQGGEYAKLPGRYQTFLRKALTDRYDRFAILAAWDNLALPKSRFTEEKLKVRGSEIPKAMDDMIANDLFEPETFADYAIEAAKAAASVKKVLDELREPRPAPADTIPWLGDTLMKEKLISVCAQGKITINVQDRERLERKPGEEIKDAYARLRGRLPDGKQLENVILGLPGAGAATQGAAASPAPSNGGASGSTTSAEGTQSGAVTATDGGTPFPTPNGSASSSGAAEGAAASLFGNGQGGSGASLPKRTPLAAAKATSGLNLAGQLEQWAIGPGSQVSSVVITLDAATGAQVKKLLEKLPDGMIYGLSLDREDGPA